MRTVVGHDFFNGLVYSVNKLKYAVPIVASLAFMYSVSSYIQPNVKTLDCGGVSNYTATLPAAMHVANLDIPYLGKWTPIDSEGNGFTVHASIGDKVHAALLNRSGAPKLTASALSVAPVTGLPIFEAHPDSGASASNTNDCSRLVNKRHCDEIFGDAHGRVSKCECIGDMPVITKLDDGSLGRFTFTNVRCIPDFKYTLLSVTQMWAEQHIDARFRDLNHLELPNGRSIPYDPNRQLCTVLLVSEQQYAASASKCPAPKQHAALLGFHAVKSKAHIEKMSAQRAGALVHRRWHTGVRRTRAAPHNSADATRNLTAAPEVSCVHCAACNIKKAPHSGELRTPAPTPGQLHLDLKGPLRRAINGAIHALFVIDEHTRFVFLETLKSKDEILLAVKRVGAAFNSLVGTPIDDRGAPLEKPKVFAIRSDHEGGLDSHAASAYAADSKIDMTKSPPHDHDLNPIAESTIAVIDHLASSMKELSGAPESFWPYIYRHAVNVHNATSTAHGSSTADGLITSYQRFTLRQPNVMDLATFGCQAVVLKPPPHQRKGDLSPRGWVGIYLGRSSASVGAYDVWVPSLRRVVTSSSVLIDEENFPWRGDDAYQPLPAAEAQHRPEPLGPPASDAPVETHFSKPSDVVAPPTKALHFLNLFSGPYNRTGGLTDRMKSLGWTVEQVDNDPAAGGGWGADLSNDSVYTSLLQKAKAGVFDALMIQIECTTYSAARFFDASKGDPSKPRGPPPVRKKWCPDGLPADQLDPKHARELRGANLVAERSLEIGAAAHSSPSKATVVIENPSDRSIRARSPSRRTSPSTAHSGRPPPTITLSTASEQRAGPLAPSPRAGSRSPRRSTPLWDSQPTRRRFSRR